MAVHTATRLERLGDYRILREVGRGGMGVVYEAEQESLGRRVALKVLPDAALADAQQVLRFQREARAAARLHHTNIVPVFGVGRDDGHHYYVMQFIPGMGLDAVLEELRRLRRGAGEQPAGPACLAGAVSAAEVAEAILTGRFSQTDPEIAEPVPNGATVTAAVTMDHPTCDGENPRRQSVSVHFFNTFTGTSFSATNTTLGTIINGTTVATNTSTPDRRKDRRRSGPKGGTTEGQAPCLGAII